MEMPMSFSSEAPLMASFGQMALLSRHGPMLKVQISGMAASVWLEMKFCFRTETTSFGRTHLQSRLRTLRMAVSHGIHTRRLQCHPVQGKVYGLATCLTLVMDAFYAPSMMKHLHGKRILGTNG